MKTNIITILGVEDLEKMVAQQQILDQTDILSYLMKVLDYEKLNESTFRKKDFDLIHIHNDGGQWSYRNELNKEDSGSVVQFIANRFYDEKPVITNDLSLIYQSTKLAKAYLSEMKRGAKRSFKKSKVIKAATSGMKKRT